MRVTLLLLMTVLLSMTACQKKDNTVPDADNVRIDVSAPLAGQIFTSGEVVSINAKVSYPGELHGYEVKIEDTSTGFIVFDNAQHVHTDNFLINTTWICAAIQATSFKLTISASINHDGLKAGKEVFIKVQP